MSVGHRLWALRGVWGTNLGPLQCAWRGEYGPYGMSGVPARGPCRVCGAPTLGLYSVSEGRTEVPIEWVRDTGFGYLGVKGPLACQSHGPNGPREAPIPSNQSN